jgi:uncharacterized protein
VRAAGILVLSIATIVACACERGAGLPDGPDSRGDEMTTTTTGDGAPAGTGSGLPGEALPGAPAIDAATRARLGAAWAARPAGYRPRTHHLLPDGSPKYTNRLLLESSPYLQQHAHNPVNWYPWGDEAFETARRLGRPVLLSIGYSTCHWCHVMEEESFEDEEIARVMNERYIAIKVDREERPDVDAIYMDAVQRLTGHGGWPMTTWLTPDRKPFHGGTYFPARDGDRGASVGFLTMLTRLAQIYAEQPEKVAQVSGDLAESIRTSLAPAASAASQSPPEAQVLDGAATLYKRIFDPEEGGVQRAPKFPSSMPVRFLLRHSRRTGDPETRQMATLSLAKMAAGGMYDHVGGGFHRYSTDAHWLVPHFEKMLYDNALLAVAYLDGYQATGREDFARVAREVLRYVERDMTSPDGAFYSASDADSLTPSGEREEGWFFTWTPGEIEAVVGPTRARIVDAWFAVTSEGNFEGRNILHTPRPLDEVSSELGVSPEQARAAIEESRELLYQARGKRPAPLRDEKILTAWNGLMISAFARAALVLGDGRYAQVGDRAADFVLGRMRGPDGRLMRSYKDGRARHNGYLPDYAFMIAALLDLYEATGNPRRLRDAVALDEVLAARFEDGQAGGFFLTSDDHEELLAREKPAYDGAEPSGNSIQTLNLLRLQELTGRDAYRQRAERALGAFGETLRTSPAALSEMLLAVDWHTDVPKEIVIVTPNTRGEAGPFLDRLAKAFVPNRVLVVANERETDGIAELVPLAAGKIARGGVPTAYVCERGTCALPTGDPAVFVGQATKVASRPAGAS